MEYTSEATANIGQTISDGIANSGKFSIKLFKGDASECEIGMPPVKEIVKAINSDNIFDIDISERLAKYCLKDRITSVLYNGVEVGRFIINDIDLPWDAYDIIVKFPLALQFIINVCCAEVIKKLIPPRIEKSTHEVAA